MQSEKAWKLQCSFSSFPLLQDGWNDFDFNVLQIFMVGTIARTLFGRKEKHRTKPSNEENNPATRILLDRRYDGIIWPKNPVLYEKKYQTISHFPHQHTYK